MEDCICIPTAERIMVTGTHGFVGARVMERFPGAVAVPSRLVRHAGEELAAFIKECAPTVIINTAAISDIGACERNPEGSYLSNVTLPVVLAKTAREVGAKLLSFSSDQVYTGCTDEVPYREDIPLPTPTNIYAKHKLEAEGRVLDIDPSAILLRATWMYDMPLYAHANRGNFITQVLNTVMRRMPMTQSTRDFRGITYVRQVADLLADMFHLPGGVYNYGSENSLSMYDTAVACFDALGHADLAESLLVKSDTHGHNLWIDCGKLRMHGVQFDTAAEGFRRCARDYFQAM